MAASTHWTEKYFVKLTEAERAQLQVLLNKGKSAAKRQLKARILRKADESELGESWSDGQVERASDDTIGRVLKKTRCNLTAKNSGLSRRRQMALRRREWEPSTPSL